MTNFCIVLITAPNLKEAQQLANGIVSEHLAACVNIIPQLESVYWWEGQIQHEQEYLLICKTHQSQWPDLTQWIKEHHSYQVPEILQIPITEGSRDYLTWIDQNVRK